MRYIKVLILSFLICASVNISAQTSHTGIRNITGLEIVEQMAPGVNLWNTLDANGPGCEGLNSETCWGNPFTTLEMITDIKERGYNTLRIPVTWYGHLGPAPDFIIDQAWLDRVEEVANYAFTNNMYVIINIHHDDYDTGKAGTWLSPTNERKEASIDQLVKIWIQIANRFKEYGDYLIFETMNEPRAVGSAEEWSGGNAEHRAVVNELNLAAVNAIRGTGGNNAERFIMTPQVTAAGHSAVQDLIIPNEDERIIVSIHNYGPFSFTLEDPGVDKWGSDSEREALRDDIKSYYDAFVSQGRAVIIGEWGVADKNNLAYRVAYYEVFAQACKDFGITPISWIYSYDRASRTWKYPSLEDAVMKVFAAAQFENHPAVSFEKIDLEAFAPVGSDFSVEVNASDPDGEVAYVELFVNNQLVSRQTEAPYLWNDQGQDALLSNLSNGTYTIKAEATDDANNTSIDVVSLEVISPTSIPAKIEAESYIEQSGIQTESTTDTGGGQNIGFIEDGDWSAYFIRVNESATYELSVRVASANNGGFIDVAIDGNQVGTLQVDSDLTNGWQDWYTTEPILVDISEGSYELTLNYRGDDGYLFNLNWLDIEKQIVTSISENPSSIKYLPYPNPTSDIVNLADAGDWRVCSVNGKVLLSGNDPLIDVSGLTNGVYFLKQGVSTYRLIKK